MIFLSVADVLKIHHRTIAEQGGSEGVRDENLLQSALTAAQNRFFYENADLAACAATYAFHLSKAHAFVDGNKRVAAVAAEVFLLINQAILNAGNDALEKLYLKIADGTLTRDEVEEFFRARLYVL